MRLPHLASSGLATCRKVRPRTSLGWQNVYTYSVFAEDAVETDVEALLVPLIPGHDASPHRKALRSKMCLTKPNTGVASPSATRAKQARLFRFAMKRYYCDNVHESPLWTVQQSRPISRRLHHSMTLTPRYLHTSVIHGDSAKSVINHRKPNLLNEASNVYVALGSNIGDRFEAIESACNIIDRSEDMHIMETSPLYETEPMYVEDQERFLNGICKIQTTLKPIDLLDQLQSIENGLGRVKLIDKGPRNIDLDIVTYENETMETERLIIPHKLMREREFVLRPLCDTDGKHFIHPASNKTAAHHLDMLPTSPSPMYPLTPLRPGMEIRSLDPKRRTHIMSILNVTPDSFSDGGVNQPTDLTTLKSTILSHIAAGATIIDIGGQSSRPNAADVTAEEELSRVLPAIELIKSLPEASHVAISIDTYRASVAAAAIAAGAHIINDISAGTLDPDMLPTIARLGCTYIMMHMRGSPHTMQSAPHTKYPPNALLSTIKSELLSRLHAAQEAGVRRWRIILDPGIGFAKTTTQNLQILQSFNSLRHDPDLKTYPWLVGSSKKGFIGEVTGVKDVKRRGYGTGVTVAAAVMGGAEIVRVHDVAETRDVVRMAEGIWRRAAVSTAEKESEGTVRADVEA